MCVFVVPQVAVKIRKEEEKEWIEDVK